MKNYRKYKNVQKVILGDSKEWKEIYGYYKRNPKDWFFGILQIYMDHMNMEDLKQQNYY